MEASTFTNIQIIGIVIGAVALVLGGVWFIIVQANKSGTNTHRFDEVEKKVNSLNCVYHEKDTIRTNVRLDNVEAKIKEHDGFSEKINALISEVSTVKTEISAVKTEISAVKTDMKYFKKTFISEISAIKMTIEYFKEIFDLRKSAGLTGFAQSNSPVVLNEQGKIASQETKMEEIIERNWTSIKAEIDKAGLTKEYDIDKFCFDNALINPQMFLSQSDIEGLKDYAFKAGKNLQAFSVIIAIIVRDKYFKEKGLPITFN